MLSSVFHDQNSKRLYSLYRNCAGHDLSLGPGWATAFLDFDQILGQSHVLFTTFWLYSAQRVKTNTHGNVSTSKPDPCFNWLKRHFDSMLRKDLCLAMTHKLWQHFTLRFAACCKAEQCHFACKTFQANILKFTRQKGPLKQFLWAGTTKHWPGWKWMFPS